MSLENIAEFVRGFLQEDDLITDVNNCRDSVLKLKAEIDKKFPKADTNFLVYPEAREGTDVHYSLMIRHNGGEAIINLVAAPGFPIYIGDPKMAVPTFSAMKVAPKVI